MAYACVECIIIINLNGSLIINQCGCRTSTGGDSANDTPLMTCYSNSYCGYMYDVLIQKAVIELTGSG